MPRGVFTRTTEHRKSISDGLKGKKRKQFSEQHKKNLSLSLKGKTYEQRYGIQRAKELKELFSKLGSGSGNSRWAGGITSLGKKIYKLLESKEWRISIFQRDNYTCQICNKKSGRLEAHHIKARSVIFKENNIRTVEDAINCYELWDINNGQTLCKTCHKKTSTYGSKSRKRKDKTNK